jgi:hypothetical protein
MFGFPEPELEEDPENNKMYNPTWVAGMGRVVSIDSSWLMFMVLFAF